MDYEECRISELVHHAVQGDGKAQELLIEEIRKYLRDLVREHGAERLTTPDFARQLVIQVQSDYGKSWAGDPEFTRWMDGTLQREAAAACEPLVRVLKPPAVLNLVAADQSVFLAGSIEMGLAEPWQAALEQALADLPVVILNPRRDDWDSAWEQSIANPNFRQQVEWELEAQERAALIAMYFAPDTKSPVTLLELGLFARSGKLVVCCPVGFWRRGNVEVVCARYGVPMVADLLQLTRIIRQRILAEEKKRSDEKRGSGVET
jgi:hypothetical protein